MGTKPKEKKSKNKKTPPPKKDKETKKTPALPPDAKTEKEIKQIIIITDGKDFKIMKADVSPLEFCEICRRILKALGTT